MVLMSTLRHRIFLLLFLSVFVSSVMCLLDSQLLRDNLIGFVNNVTNFHSMQEEFDKTKGEHIRINSTELVNGFTSKLEDIFKDKREHLMRVKQMVEGVNEPDTEKQKKKKAEEEETVSENHEEHDYYTYPNMREVSWDDNDTFVINPTFSLDVKVNMNESFVHVPTNIYAKSDAVLKIAAWTKKLDEVFKYNFNVSKKTLLYQYYGDHSGFLRVYPGNNNSYTPTHVDLYDSRRRPWYIQSSSSPKDIVIVIDHSGSMIGSKIGIAKIATAALIDTLEENDFFNVITVNTNVTYMEQCLKYLLQATKTNKERLTMLVQSIPDPEKEMNHIKGLKTAFELLNSAKGVNRSYASCNRVIVFITDGIESDYSEEKKLFEKYNKDKDTRVFTYLVGRTKNPDKEALLKMACFNDGYLYKLETIGNVWDTVMKYLYVMARPLVIAKTKLKALFTPAYLDSTGLGMIISISVPVFNIKEDTLMGVVGTDISITTLNDLLPHAQLATFGHGFIITNNGYIVYHPQFRTQKGMLPAPPNILMEELERAVDVENIIRVKKEMIDRIPDIIANENNTFPVYFVYDNSQRLSITNGTYNYQSIKNTEFSAGIVISERERYLFNFMDDNVTLLINGINALDAPTVNMSIPNITVSNWTYVKVSPWNYLNLSAAEQEAQPYSIKAYPSAAELFDYLQDVSSWNELSDMVPENFSTQLVKNMIVSAAITIDIVEKAWVPERLDDGVDYESLFVATAAGYSRFLTFSNTSQIYDRDVLNIPIFQHALANPDAKVIFSAPYTDPSRQLKDDYWITVVAPIKKNGIIIAVTGMIFEANIMLQHFENSTTPFTHLGFNDEKHKCYHNTSVICALLDQNGYIIASNQGLDKIGSFIGEQSVFIVNKLVEVGVLKEINIEDTQGNCHRKDPRRASGNILLTPAKLILNVLAFFMQALTKMSMQAIIFVMSIFQRSDKTSASNIPVIHTSCTTQMQFYLFQPEAIKKFKEVEDKSIKCSKEKAWCYMKIEEVQVVQDTNLVFLRARIRRHPTCIDLCRKGHVLKHSSSSSQETSFNYCSNKTGQPIDTKQKYRRRSSTCFNGSVPKRVKGRRKKVVTRKKKYKCGRGGIKLPVLWLHVVALFVTIMM